MVDKRGIEAKDIHFEQGQKPSEFIAELANSIDRKQEPVPTWHHEMDSLKIFLEKIEDGKGVRVSGTTSEVQENNVQYPRSVKEAQRGIPNANYRFSTTSESVYVQTDVRGRLPTNEENAVPQIQVMSLWAGGPEGIDNEVLDELKKISELQTDDFQDQAREKLTKFPDEVEENLKRVEDHGRKLSRRIIEASSLHSQRVHWSIVDQKPRAETRFTLKSTGTLGGNKYLKLSGPNQYIEGDSIRVPLEDASTAEDFFDSLDSYVDKLRIKQYKNRGR